jgi:asparagine synthase (glutamine-hydrolysing)
MCGISAVFRYTAINDDDIAKLNAMNQEMHYRGPDDNGVWNDSHCGLAQVRLSIIGLQKGKQPLFNEDDSLVLICNGEIYNYIELKEDLIKKGHQFKSESDSETILHLYEEYGVECLNYLRGMFAFCLYDIKSSQMFVARDRVGEKTLYYSQIQTGVVFSTELKAILKYYIDKPQLNFEQLAAPIRYTAPTSNVDTYIDQIKRLEPGQYILVDEHGLEKCHYWKRDLTPRFVGSYDHAKSETLRILRESIDIHLRSDVPVAIMLSGGIDSSAIAALAKETGREVHTITAGYKGSHSCDERDVAKRFADERGFIYHEVELDESDFQSAFDEFTSCMDEPITDMAAFAQWTLYKKVKGLGFKVLLSGNGGDELFYGYPYWNELANSLEVFRQHQSLFPWKGFEKKKQYVNFLFKNFKSILFAGYPYKINNDTIGSWFVNDYLKFIEDGRLVFNNQEYQFRDNNLPFVFENNTKISELDFLYKFLFEQTMTKAYLYLSDRLGMGNSIEIRSPLLDYKLVNFVSGLPLEIKYVKGNPKSFLKDCLEGVVPDYILNARKRGFEPPSGFVKAITENYQYQFLHSDYKFYNSILIDKLLMKLLPKSI